MTTFDELSTRSRRRLTAQIAAAVIVSTTLACSAGALPSQQPTATVPRATATPSQTIAPTPTSNPSASAAATAPWIAYQGPDGLRLVRLDGTDDHLFPSLKAAQARHPDWSPDGDWLTYRVDGPGETDTIWISRADGSEARQLVDCDSPCLFVDDPAWSPDGTRIALWRDTADKGQALNIVDVASGAAVAVITGGPGERPTQPRWSPAGDRLVIEIERYDASGEIVGNRLGLIDLADEKPIIEYLTPPEMPADYPDWSPSADTILFEAGNGDPFSLEGEPVQLFTISSDGSDLLQLTTRTAAEPLLALPAWAVGGSAILLTLIHSRDNFTLARADSDGSNLTEILGENGQPIIGAHTRAAGR